MTLKSKICGVSDFETLDYIINHKSPPQFIGFIVNYLKSNRYVEFDKLKNLTNTDKKKTNFVAVMVKPNQQFLDKIKDLNFDYYQIYDSSPDDVKMIKEKYKKKIIIAITIDSEKDVINYKNYEDIADIYLFDSKGYEQSLSFDHKFIKNLNLKKEIMVAGNIKFDDKLENYKKIADIIDISGGLESSGLKDISKIEFFLSRLKIINDKN
tara:strand:- start:415 stop:1044 length:630 start_codon:yes stop_codon:yes gene_type:complete